MDNRICNENIHLRTKRGIEYRIHFPQTLKSKKFHPFMGRSRIDRHRISLTSQKASHRISPSLSLLILLLVKLLLCHFSWHKLKSILIIEWTCMQMRLSVTLVIFLHSTVIIIFKSLSLSYLDALLTAEVRTETLHRYVDL